MFDPFFFFPSQECLKLTLGFAGRLIFVNVLCILMIVEVYMTVKVISSSMAVHF